VGVIHRCHFCTATNLFSGIKGWAFAQLLLCSHHRRVTSLKFLLPCAMVLACLNSGCTTVNRLAVNKVADALASGGSTFGAEDDPELVKAAVPFSLKLMESLLAQSPNHRGLLLATASGFTQYGFAFVQQEADELEQKDFAAAQAMRGRARRLYLRARDYGLRGLEASHQGFTGQLRADPVHAARQALRSDVPLLYWTAASWAAAISLAKDEPDLIADLPLVEALVDRALELNEAFDSGAIHGFLITYEMARQTGAGDPAARARRHFERLVEITGGRQAAPFVSLAESVALPRQDRKEFVALLNRALEVKADAQPEWRLANLIMQRRARWLLNRVDELILETEKPQSEKP
jgi:predicted anti-sigma-YlaC factor YlaD